MKTLPVFRDLGLQVRIVMMMVMIMMMMVMMMMVMMMSEMEMMEILCYVNTGNCGNRR